MKAQNVKMYACSPLYTNINQNISTPGEGEIGLSTDKKQPKMKMIYHRLLGKVGEFQQFFTVVCSDLHIHFCNKNSSYQFQVRSCLTKGILHLDPLSTMWRNLPDM